MGFSPTFGARRFPKGERKELWCARRRKPFFRPGLTRRLRRGRWGCRPEGGSTFFRSERKYQRKHAARRLRRRPAPLRVAGFGLREPFGLSSTSVRCAHPPGKRLLLPILPAGLATSRASKWRVISCAYARSCARLFPPSKWAAFFPSLPIAARLPRRWRRADSTNAYWDVLARLGWLCSAKQQTWFLLYGWYK